jgi:hypothetical protein
MLMFMMPCSSFSYSNTRGVKIFGRIDRRAFSRGCLTRDRRAWLALLGRA